MLPDQASVSASNLEHGALRVSLSTSEARLARQERCVCVCVCVYVCVRESARAQAQRFTNPAIYATNVRMYDWIQ